MYVLRVPYFIPVNNTKIIWQASKDINFGVNVDKISVWTP